MFDVEAEIIKRNYPSPVDIAPFQKRLDEIAGVDVSGRSNIKISWGQDMAEQMIICGVWHMKFCFYRFIDRKERLNPANGLIEISETMQEIGTPRFFISELHSNSELHANDRWENARYVWVSETERMDVLGPVPDTGFYTPLFTVAYHDELCCDGDEFIKGNACLGAYREPNETDLERVRRMKWRRDHASPDELMADANLTQKRAMDWQEKRNEKWQKGVREALDDAFRTHAVGWTTLDPTVKKWGKYAFLSAHNKSGTKKEDKTNGDSGL